MSRGEFILIDRFLAAFERAGGRTTGGAVTLGPGDDTAIVRSPRPLAVTTDALVEDVHFRLGRATPRQIGHKALAVNLSDLAAMGARASAFTCAIAMPKETPLELVEGLAEGMGSLAGRTGAVLAGGNFTKARELSITVTAMGELETEPMLRSAARAGDQVLLIGELGVAAAELIALEAGRVLPPGRSAQHEPEPLLSEGLIAARHARCGIDVSDGLAQDLGHVAKASGVRVVLSFDRIPRSPRFLELTASLGHEEQARLQLAGGEDYALVVAAPAARAQKLLEELPAACVIGRVENGEGVVVENAPTTLGRVGHDHFA